MRSSRYRFGQFEFDVEPPVLRRNGAVVRLQAQPKQVLACLVTNAGRVVSREELIKEIWGEGTFVDFERGLNFCISQIRSALKDEATDPKYIRTIAKQGYQFIAPVEEHCDFAVAASPAAQSSEMGRSRWGKISAIAILSMILVLAFIFWKRSTASAHERPTVAVVRFDNETQNPDLNRLSDGLSDVLVERLTSLSNGRYGVIGNALILRAPREQRNLETISSSLHAKYIVLGQLQASGSQTRLLVHLIRMPEQTHIWVARIDRASFDPVELDKVVDQKVGSDFARQIASDLASEKTAQHGAIY